MLSLNGMMHFGINSITKLCGLRLKANNIIQLEMDCFIKSFLFFISKVKEIFPLPSLVFWCSHYHLIIYVLREFKGRAMKNMCYQDMHFHI